MSLTVNFLAGDNRLLESFLGLINRLALSDGSLLQSCDGGPVVEAEDVIGCRYLAVVLDVRPAALPDLPGCRDRPAIYSGRPPRRPRAVWTPAAAPGLRVTPWTAAGSARAAGVSRARSGKSGASARTGAWFP